MTDFATFGIELVDQVSKPATRAADALERMEKQMGGVGSGVDRMQGQLKGLMHSRAFEIIADKANHLAGALEGVFMRGVHTAVGLVEKLVHGTIEMATFADASKRAMSALTGSDAMGQAAFERTIVLANDLGLNIEMATHAMQKMLAMQFTAGEGEKFIKLTSDLRAVGVQADSVERILMDIAHIKATGFLNGRELQTFAMAGVSTALIMKEVGVELSKKFGGAPRTVEQAYEAMRKKQVTSEMTFAALERAIMAKTHEHSIGEAGAKFAGGTLQGLFEQLKNAPTNMLLRVSQITSDMVPKLSAAVRSMKSFIDNLDTAKIAKFVDGIVDVLLKAVPLAMEFAKGFMDGFKDISTAFGKFGVEADSLKTAHDLGRLFADTLGKILEILTSVANLLKPLMNDTGAWLLGGVYLATRLGGALSTVASILNLFGVGGAARAAAGLAGAAGGGGAGGAAAGAAGAAETAASGFALGAGASTALAVGSGLALAGGLGYAAYGLYQSNEERKQWEQQNAEWERNHARARREQAMAGFFTALAGPEAGQSLQPGAPGYSGLESRYAMSARSDSMPQIDKALSDYEATAQRATDTYRYMPPQAKGGLLGRQQNTANITNNFYVTPDSKGGGLTPEGAREMGKTVQDAQEANIIDTLAGQLGSFLTAR